MILQLKKASLYLNKLLLSSILTTYVIKICICHLVLIRYLLDISSIFLDPENYFRNIYVMKKLSNDYEKEGYVTYTHTHLDILGETPW